MIQLKMGSIQVDGIKLMWSRLLIDLTWKDTGDVYQTENSKILKVKRRYISRATRSTMQPISDSLF